MEPDSWLHDRCGTKHGTSFEDTLTRGSLQRREHIPERPGRRPSFGLVGRCPSAHASLTTMGQATVGGLLRIYDDDGLSRIRAAFRAEKFRTVEFVRASW